MLVNALIMHSTSFKAASPALISCLHHCCGIKRAHSGYNYIEYGFQPHLTVIQFTCKNKFNDLIILVASRFTDALLNCQDNLLFLPFY